MTTLTAKKGILPSITTADSYTIYFNNKIYNVSTTYEGAVTSTAFSYTGADGTVYGTCYLDDLNGVMRIYYLLGGEKVIIIAEAGTVDYDTGTIVLTSFLPNSYVGSILDFTIQPAENDLVPVRNQLFEIANTNITITMQDDAGTGTVSTSTSATGATSSVTIGTATGSTTTY